MQIRQRVTKSPIKKPEMSASQTHDKPNDLLEVRHIGSDWGSLATDCCSSKPRCSGFF